MICIKRITGHGLSWFALKDEDVGLVHLLIANIGDARYHNNASP